MNNVLKYFLFIIDNAFWIKIQKKFVFSFIRLLKTVIKMLKPYILGGYKNSITM